MANIFESVEVGPPIEVFALTANFLKDPSPKKVNLGVGAYRTEEAKPWVLPVVRKAQIEIATNEALNHEYISVTGTDDFTKASVKLLLGDDSPAIADNRAVGIQCLSGTGALRMGAEFLVRQLNKTVFYYSIPTWDNHHRVFMDAGFKEAKKYRYWDPANRNINFAGLLEDLEAAPEGAVIILHACAHNPTGSDPSQDQWKQIADLMERKKLFPFFDSAYQGFASGDPNKDAWAVRYFVSRGFQLFCSQSYAKNFGLYGERIGNLTVVQKDSSKTAAIVSQMSLLVRGMYSNPPAYGSQIVSKVLNTPELKAEWMQCIQTMSSRIIRMRKMLYDALVELKTPGTWEHIIQQIGMFSYTGLNEEQSLRLVKDYNIYLLRSGRISMCGLTEKNVRYVAESIHEVITTFAPLTYKI